MHPDLRRSARPVWLPSLALAILLAPAAAAQTKPRARDLGVPFDGTPGPLDAITDVAGVEVGHATIVRGSGRLVVGRGPVRTGVTAVFPRGKGSADPVFAGWFTLNGNGEMTGTTWLEESGFLAGPVMITNTHSVGVVRDAVIEWLVRSGQAGDWSLPVVAETWDGSLNDINGFHVTREHVFAAVDSARGGRVGEGNVGGGTGMVCHQFKGGIGTASRRLRVEDGGYTVGVLVQCNYGRRGALRVAGAPVGAEIPDLLPCYEGEPPRGESAPRCAAGGGAGAGGDDLHRDAGSIIVVVATDAPLLPHQLRRVVRRVALGVGRTGGIGANSSGDIFVAFSTANPRAARAEGSPSLTMLPNERINPVFEATVQATEEAIVNALVAAETMTGVDGFRVPALPHARLRQALAKYNRLAKP